MDLASILGSLSESDLDRLQQTAKTLFSGGEEDGKSAPPPPPVDLRLMEGISKLSRAMSENDEKTDLLRAMRPFLSEARQKRADEAVSFVRVYNAIRLLREGGIGLD